MRSGPRIVTAAAALLTGAVLAGCAPADLPEAGPTGSHPPAVVAPPPDREPIPLGPEVVVPVPAVPTVQGPHVAPEVPAPVASSSGSPSTSPTPQPSSPHPTPPPSERTLLDILPSAAALPPLQWRDAGVDRTATWRELTPAAAIDVSTAITHVAAARQVRGACSAAADAVDRRALEAAVVSLAADPAPGAPFDLVVMRYPSPRAAADALTALRALGVACDGVETDEGVLGAGEGASGATAVLRADDAVLVVEGATDGALLIAVLHKGAPSEAVAALLAAPSAAQA